MFNADFNGPDVNVEFHQNPDAIGVLRYRVDYESGEAVTSHFIDALQAGEPATITFGGVSRDTFKFTDQYTLAENRAANPTNGPQRVVNISIYTQNAANIWTTLSEDILTGVATNPALPAPTVTLSRTPTGIDGRVTLSGTFSDVAEYLIWVSSTPSISTATTPTYRQVGETFSVPIADDTPRYVRAAVVDHFGDTPLNASTEVSASRSTFNVDTVDDAVAELDAALAVIDGQITLSSPTAGSIGARFLTAETLTGTTATKVSGLESVVGTSDSLGLRARVISAETVITNLPTNYASASRATALEAQMAGTTTSNLRSRIASLETVTTDGTFATASSLSTLSSTVGGHTGSISALNTTTADHTSALAEIAVLATVDGLIAGYKISNDGTTADFTVLAPVFKVQDTLNATGVAPFEVRNGGVRMKAATVDRLNATASITVGTANLRVAVQPFDLSVTDGTVVSFGYDLGYNPNLTFSSLGLAPTASGENYQLYADSLSPTGFIARLKISTPGTPTDVNYGPTGYSSDGTRPFYYVLTDGTSSSGTYSVRCTGNIQSYFYNDSYNPYGPTEVGETYTDGYLELKIWGYNGTSWVGIGTMSPSPAFRSYSDAPGNYTDAYDETISVSASSEIIRIGVSKDYESYPSTVADLRVSYQVAGATGTRTATPSGQQAVVTVRPRT